MKFEKFVKNVGTHGKIIDGGVYEKWLMFDNVMCKIPRGSNVIAPAQCEMTEWQKIVIDNYDYENLMSANLSCAKLPTPDASPSMLRRIFTDPCGGRIEVDNKTFKIIERGNNVYIFADRTGEKVKSIALVVTEEYGVNETIAAIVFDETYYYKKTIEKE